MRGIAVGIAGGSGSGKSTLARQLSLAFPGTSCLLPFDAYYKEHRGLSPAQREAINYDHPDALDLDLYLRHARALLRGEAVTAPIYDFSRHCRKEESLLISPGQLVILEGNLVLALSPVRALLDVKVFVEVPEEERLARRILRDREERGRSEESVRRQFSATVRPMHQALVQPSSAFAEVLAAGGRDPEALEEILEKIRAQQARRGEKF